MNLEEKLEEMLNQLHAQSKPKTPDVLTIADTAKLLKCSERSIKHHLYEAKDLKYLLVGREVRILETDLREFLEKRRKPCVHDKEILP